MDLIIPNFNGVRSEDLQDNFKNSRLPIHQLENMYVHVVALHLGGTILKCPVPEEFVDVGTKPQVPELFDVNPNICHRSMNCQYKESVLPSNPPTR